MKKFLCISLCAVLCAGVLAGCGTSFESDTNALYVDKKGTVTAVEVEEFEADYYDAAELETYVEDAVDAYVQENGKKRIKIQNLTVEDNRAVLRMQYETAEDYSQFNGIELYQGNVVSALAAGYEFQGDFAKVEDGVVTGSALKNEIYQEDNLKVVVIRANMDVTVEGEICYVSTDNVTLTGKNQISIRENSSLGTGAGEAVSVESSEAIAETEQPEEVDMASFETDVYTYIIYK